MIANSMRAAALAALFLGSPHPGLAQSTSIQAQTLMTQSAMLTVPGAQIYYETQGSGPTLLIIPGGPQDAGVFAALASELADRYTVLTYDPRGNSRTLVTGELGALDLDQQADDAAALIAKVGAPAYVFGTSGGAQIGFNLAARHPQSVITLIAHEPPTTALLPDPAPAQVADQALYQTYKDHGVDAAMGQFFAENGLQSEETAPPVEMSPEEAETFGRVMGNFEYWLAHGMLPLSNYQPDIATLRAGKPRIVVAIGEGSKGQPIAEMSAAASAALGLTPVNFPGDHMGFGSEAASFAARLGSVLSAP